MTPSNCMTQGMSVADGSLRTDVMHGADEDAHESRADQAQCLLPLTPLQYLQDGTTHTHKDKVPSLALRCTVPEYAMQSIISTLDSLVRCGDYFEDHLHTRKTTQ